MAVNSTKFTPHCIESIPESKVKTKPKTISLTITHPSGRHTGLTWNEKGDIFYHSASRPGEFGFLYRKVSPSKAKKLLYELVTNMRKGDKIDVKV